MAFLLLLVLLMQRACCTCETLPRHHECEFDKDESPPARSWEHLQPCCESLCHCNKVFVLCVGHHRNLTYIPKLTDSIVMLNFSSNSLEMITELTFSNISQSEIQYLWLRNNNITQISKNAFNNFTSIQHLDLSENPISQENLKSVLYGLKNFPLKYLNVGYLSLHDLVYEILMVIRYMRTLIVNNNNIQVFDFSLLMEDNYLESLDLSYNKIYHLNNTFLSILKNLMFNSNKLVNFPDFCRNKNKSSIQRINLSYNYLTHIKYHDLKCLTSLTALCLVRNRFKVLDSNQFSSLSNLKILRIEAAFIQPANGVDKYAFSNSALTELFADELGIDFPKQMSKLAFRGCRKLKNLSMKFNNLMNVDDSYLMHLLGHLTTLKELILFRCQLNFFPRVISERLKYLEKLDLYANKIKTLKANSFQGMTKLKWLSIAQNGLVHIKSDVFPLKVRQQLTYINLANNSFICTCANLWFIQWMKKDYNKFKGYPHDYKCGGQSSQKPTLMIDTSLTEISCTLSPVTVPVILSVSGFTMVCLVLVSVLYRWRWHIRYYIHMLRYRRRHQLLNEEENLFTYDAFVLFCDDDFGFVREHLMPKVEDEGMVRLCVHQRDFTPGAYIVDNIIDSLDQSRKVVLLLSNAFSDSSWCEFELALVQKRALEKQGGYLMVILLEDLETQNMTSSMCALLQTTTYIMWPQDQRDRDMFWERVKTCLGQ